MILGLDPAQATGWALLNDDGSVFGFGTWQLYATPRQSHQVRYRTLWDSLESMYGFEITAAGFEHALSQNSKAQACNYGGYRGIILLWADLHKIPMESVHWSHMKLASGMGGRATKDEMVAAARAKWHLAEHVTHDEADALWCAEVVRRRASGD